MDGKQILVILTTATVAACGGGSTSSQSSGATGGSPSFQTVSFGAIDSASGSIAGGEFVPSKVTINGAEKVVYQTNSEARRAIYSDGATSYLTVAGTDGASHGIIGYDWLTGEVFGSSFTTASASPTSGSASYAGRYTGQLRGLLSSVYDEITGTANVDVDFDAGTINGVITNRTDVIPTIGYDLDSLESDIVFSGSVNDGAFNVTHNDSNSSGAVTGAIYADGVIGTVAVTHTNAHTIGSSIPEIGTFSAN